MKEKEYGEVTTCSVVAGSEEVLLTFLRPGGLEMEEVVIRYHPYQICPTEGLKAVLAVEEARVKTEEEKVRVEVKIESMNLLIRPPEAAMASATRCGTRTSFSVVMKLKVADRNS